MFPNLVKLSMSECLPNQLEELRSLEYLTLGRGSKWIQPLSSDIQQLSEEFLIFKLKQLDLSNSRVSSNVAYLVCHTFPVLEDLILRSCDFTPADGSCLAQANASGRLPKLKHLDVFDNRCTANDLFETKSHWNQL